MVVSSRAWRRSIAGWLMLCPLLSCQRQGGPFVNLLLTNFSPEAATVSLTVTAQGESRELQFSGNDSLNIITYEFPIGFRGDTRFEARASLSPDCVVGIGSSELQIDEDRAYDLKLPLTTDAASRCVPYGVRLTVIKAGTAQSVVSSSPPAVHCDETCSQQTVAFRAGEQVKLSSVVTGDDLFAGAVAAPAHSRIAASPSPQTRRSPRPPTSAKASARCLPRGRPPTSTPSGASARLQSTRSAPVAQSSSGTALLGPPFPAA